MANIFKAKTLVGRTGLFSHEVIAPNLVFNTGNQIISGNKTFLDNIIVSRTGIFNNLNLNSISSLNISGVDVYITDGIVYSNQQIYSSNLIYNTGNQNIAGIKNFYSRPTVNSIPVLLSGEPNNVVYTTGNQNISGNKTFVNNIEVQGTGIFNAVDLSNISGFQFSGVTMNLVDTNVYISGGWIYISGNPVLTTINLNNVVYTTGDQTIVGIKDFNNIINVSGIQFDLLTTPQTPAYQEGLLYYSDSSKTLNLYSDVAGLELPIGQENWLRAKNLTNSTITPGTVVYINGAQGNTPLVQRSIATGDSTSARTVAIAAHSINDNSKGYFTTFGIVENINTSAFSVGDTLYLSWTESGKLTGVKPQAPYHMVRIGNVIDKGNNGSIFVNIQNGFEIEELHDVRIINQQNKDGIVYNSASGLWLNTPVALADEVVYLTGNQIISGNKTFLNNINVSGTGIFDAVDINNIDALILSGVDISITNGVVSSNSAIFGSNIVYNTGNQFINGNKTFLNNIEVQGTGIFNSVDLSNISGFQFSGVTMNLVDTNVYISGGWIYISGNPVSTGVSSSSLTVSNLNNIVYTTGNQIISGNKTFSQTGEFQALKINKNRFLSYDYETGNFNFVDYITIVNSTLSGSGDFVTGILPIGSPVGNISGFNFLLKNINTCPVLITGSGRYTIDGEPNLYIYKGESVELLGVQALGLTGWYTLNTNLGVM